jgi:hypothetical protein
MSDNSGHWINRRRFLGVLAGATAVLSAGRQSPASSLETAEETSLAGNTSVKKKWFEEVQTYGTVTLPPALAEASHLTVNGLASGIGHASVVRMFAVYQMYPDDESYVRDIKAKGIRCSAYVPGFILRQAKAQLFPILNQAKCVGYFGDTPTIGPPNNPMFGGQDYYLCNNRPACREFQLELGKRAIDLGVDCIFFDEIQGSTTTLMPQLGIPGFCPDCLGGFTAYLRRNYTPAQLKEQFDIDDLDRFDFRAWLGQHSPLPDMRQVPRDQLQAVLLPAFKRLANQPLAQAYQRYQFEANHQKKSAVIRALREYARSKGREIAVTANISNLDVGERPSLPFMIGGLEFAEVVDFMACEINTALREPGQGPYWPSGKWVSYYRMGQSVCKAPTVLMAGVGFWNELQARQGGPSRQDDLYVAMFLDAYALGGAMVNYQVWPDKNSPDGIEPLYRKTTTAAKFVLDNKDLYEDLEPLAETAIFFRYFPAPQPYGHSYMGLAQALAESQIPFRVLTQGDGTYIKATVTLKDLRQFKIVYAMFLENLRPDEKTMLLEYARAGGTIVLFDPKLLGMPEVPLSQEQGRGWIIILPRVKTPEKELDHGTRYFATYDDKLRRELAEPVRRASGEALRVRPASRHLIAYPYRQRARHRLVVHVVNYDYDQHEDVLRQQQNVTVSVRRLRGVKPSGTVTLRGWEFAGPTELPLTVSKGYWTFTIPSLTYAAAAVIGLR